MKKIINLAEVNFILTLAGFGLFTTFIQNSAGSIIYRAFALLVALLCIFESKKQKQKHGSMMKVFMTLYYLLVFFCMWDLYVGYYSDTPFTSSRNMAALFVMGVTFFPVLAFYKTFEKIRWESTLTILFIVLFFVLAIGQIRGITDEASGRGSLNTHMTTLGLAELAVYMTLVSTALLKKSSGNRHSKLFKALIVAGLILGFLSLGRAASRGPFVAGLIGLSYFIISERVMGKAFALFFIALMFTMGTLTSSLFEKFAPVLYNRIVYTIESEDTGGRDALFDNALNTLKEKPITGDVSIMLEPNAMSSCHNMYLDLGLELGVVGGLTFIIISLVLLFWCLTSGAKGKITIEQCFFAALFMFHIVRGMSGLTLSSCPVLVATYIGIIWCRERK